MREIYALIPSKCNKICNKINDFMLIMQTYRCITSPYASATASITASLIVG